MDSGAAISVEDYLHMSFPGLDQEYRDGEIVERSMPDYRHSRTQALICVLFEALRRKLSLYACPELRLKLREGLFRIPDVSVFWPSPPGADVPDSPPLVAIEILSPNDRLSELRNKLEEYHRWGVKHVWLVDPHGRRTYSLDRRFAETGSLRIADLDVEMTADAIFE